MIEKLESPKTIIETIYTVNSDVTSYLDPVTLDKLRRRPTPVFPNYVNTGEVFARENHAVILSKLLDVSNNAWSNYVFARRNMLDNSVYNNWDNEWRHMELRYAVETDIGQCTWCKSEDNPILRKEIIVREQKTCNTFNSLHKYCALDKLIKLKSEIEIGIERLETMINKTNGMKKGDKR